MCCGIWPGWMRFIMSRGSIWIGSREGSRRGGIFGDIFDVVVTAKGKSGILNSYPVVILAGEVSISQEWAKALSGYMERGGTLVVCGDQISGEGAGGLNLPQMGPTAEADSME